MSCNFVRTVSSLIQKFNVWFSILSFISFLTCFFILWDHYMVFFYPSFLLRPYSHETQYCDKKIKRYFWTMDFKTNQGKLLTKHRVPWFVVCWELTLAYRDPWRKNIFLSQYLLIAILCVKIPRVNKALSSSDVSTLLSKVLGQNATFTLLVVGRDVWSSLLF